MSNSHTGQQRGSALAASLLAMLLSACMTDGSAQAGTTAAASRVSPAASHMHGGDAAIATGRFTRAASPTAERTPSTHPASPTQALLRDKALTAYHAVDALRVAVPLSHAGYSRSQFGKAWLDVDGNRCDTRDDILARDLRSVARSGFCKVVSGTLRDPYTGQTIYYVRGGGNGVDIDHVVALSNAWESGAARWPFAKRVALANDPANLLAVDASANRQKGDSDASQWLPQPRYQCAYVARQVLIKRKYQLFVAGGEKASMKRVLSRCTSMPLPSPGSQPTLAVGVGSAPAGSSGGSAGGSTGGSGSSGQTQGTAGADPRFSSCAKAKAAGYGPYVRGRDPEYSWYRDRDADGTVCE